jgi:probable O-glycosylation ligase (exosortase A-associated)
MNPHRLAFGFAHDFPVAMTIGSATLLGLVLAVARKEVQVPAVEVETALLSLFVALFTVSSVFALDPDVAWEYWMRTFKILCLAFAILIVCDDRTKLRYLLLTMVLSIGFYGFKGGIFALVTGFENRVWGPEGSFLADANDVAMCLNMILPILFFLAKHESGKVFRLGLYSTFWLSVFAIISTYSRGGFVTLAVVLFLLFIRSERKAMFLIPIVIGGLVVVPLIPDKYVDRIQSIETASEQDGSAIERLNAWRFSWNLATDRPFTGGGFDPIRKDIWERYAPEYKDKPTSAHSIYFQVLGDHGFIALGVFLLIYASALKSCRKLQRVAEGMPGSAWVGDYGRMMEISIVAFLLAGAFYNRAYVDIAFHVVCIVVVLKRLSRMELHELPSSTVVPFIGPAHARI